jgi:hypothetical protein
LSISLGSRIGRVLSCNFFFLKKVKRKKKKYLPENKKKVKKTQKVVDGMEDMAKGVTTEPL